MGPPPHTHTKQTLAKWLGLGGGWDLARQSKPQPSGWGLDAGPLFETLGQQRQPGERRGHSGLGSTCLTGVSEEKVQHSHSQNRPEARSSGQEEHRRCEQGRGRPVGAQSSVGFLLG